MRVIFEDADLVAVDKPAGLLVHAAPGHAGEPTVTDWLVRHCPAARSVGSADRPGVVHRLDRETSGVMVLAKNQATYLKLRRLFENHADVRKRYLAVMHGTPKPRRGTVDSPVKGRPARSHYEVLAAHDGISLVEWTIETGRTHQIRLHAAGLGHPILGDTLYGSAQKDRSRPVRPARLLLHAVTLGLPGREFSAPPPPDILFAR